MIDPATYLIFMLAAFGLLLSPGPAVLYIITRSVDQGRLAGVVSSAGLGLGNFVQVLAATLGLSALLVSSAAAFGTVKILGAGYLIFLGLRKIFSRPEKATGERPPPEKLRRIFRQGVIVNILNPKVALFFLAFLPQFIDAGRGDAALQIFILGTSFALLGIITDIGYALLAGSAGNWLKQNAAYWKFERFITGGIYLALGVGTALVGNAGRDG